MINFKYKFKQIFFFLTNIENKSYIFSRFASVSIKPLILFICIFFNFEEFGALIAMIFLVSSVNITFASIPIFRNFYLNIDNKSPQKKKHSKDKYKSEIIILFLISLIFLIPLNEFFKNNIEILVTTVLVFSIDKIYDEIQRFLIIKKNFYEWSILTNYKNITLLIFFLNPLMNVNVIFLGAIYFIINFLKYFKYINISFKLNLSKEIKRFFFSLKKNKKIFILNYLLVFYTVGDKIVVGKLFNENLAEYLLLGNILSIPLLFINFFYISKYRTEFVKNIITFNDVIFSKKFNYLLISTFFLTIIMVAIYYFTKLSGLSIKTFIFLFLIYIINVYNLILDEIIYWKSFYKDFLFFECLFIFFFLSIFFLTAYNSLNLEIFLIMILCIYFLKILFKYIIFIKKMKI